MNESPLSDVVSRQYERWVYPLPIDDLAAWVRDYHEFFDPSHSHRVFWPDRDYAPDLDILIAGCGANQAAAYAFTNRSARVIGIDVSQASLAHEQYLKDKHGLANLELHRLPIEEVATLERDFDLVVSTGVLHHMADPLAGLKALGALLRPDGALALMLYAKYGRVGVDILQSVFRDLGLRQDDASLNLVKDTISHLPRDHLARPCIQIHTDAQFDSGLVDSFLHRRERSYSVGDCLELVTQAGLVFQGWLDNNCYYPESILPQTNALYAALARLPEAKLWSVMERLNTQNGCHFFIACRADRPKRQYAIDFSRPEFVAYVPVPRHSYRIEGNEIVRMKLRCAVSNAQLAFLRQVDGRRTIAEIVVRAAGEGVTGDAPEVERFIRELFQSMWRLGCMAIALDRQEQD